MILPWSLFIVRPPEELKKKKKKTYWVPLPYMSAVAEQQMAIKYTPLFILARVQTPHQNTVGPPKGTDGDTKNRRSSSVKSPSRRIRDHPEAQNKKYTKTPRENKNKHMNPTIHSSTAERH